MTPIPQELIERLETAVRDAIKAQAGGHEVKCHVPPDYKPRKGWSIGKSTLVPSLIAEAAIREMMPKMEWVGFHDTSRLLINGVCIEYFVEQSMGNLHLWHSYFIGENRLREYVGTNLTYEAAKAAAEQAYLKHWGGVE